MTGNRAPKEKIPLGRTMEDVLKDVRFALRTMVQKPGLSLFALLSLALGIGATTGVFSLAKAVFLRSIPVAEPERLISVFATDAADAAGPGFLFISYPNYLDFREMNQVFSGLAVYRPVTLRLTGGGDPEVVQGDLVSGNYFDVLGVQAGIGRTFLPEEDRAPGSHPVVVLTHGLWARRFASDPRAIGRQVQLNGHPFTVVGVTPKSFNSLHVHGAPEFFVPTMMYQQVLSGPARDLLQVRNALMFFAVGRLKPGISALQADQDMKRLAGLLERDYPDLNEGLGVTTMPLTQATIHPAMHRQFSASGGLVIAAVVLLLLTACANVANMQIARALERRREMAIRSAVGAGRGRLARQLLTEGLVLTVLGGAAGLLVAIWVRDALWALRPRLVGDFLDVSLDGPVLAVGLAISLACGLLFGLMPMMLVSRLELASELKAGETLQVRSGQRLKLRGALVAVQMTLAFVSIVGAGLFLASLQKIRSVDPGFNPGNLAVVLLNVAWQDLEEPAGQELFRRAVERVESLPGVRSAGLARGLLLGGGHFRSGVTVEGGEAQEDEAPTVAVDPISDRFLETAGIPILQGRGFTAADRQDAPLVAVINRTMAQRFWPGRNAIGQRFRLTLQEGSFEVVGIAQNAKYLSLSEPPQPYVYLPLSQSYSPDVILYVRTETDAEAMLPTLRREIQALAPEMPLTRVETMAETLERSLWAARLGAGLLTLFAVLALVLSAIGIYGVMARSVRSRRRELGIRMALGARKVDMIRMIILEGLRQVTAGMVLGLALTAVAVPAISGFLFEFKSTAPLVFGGGVLLLVSVAVLAMFLPARRASALGPLTAIREE